MLSEINSTMCNLMSSLDTALQAAVIEAKPQRPTMRVASAMIVRETDDARRAALLQAHNTHDANWILAS
jgi:hypothetical protein